MPMTIPSGQAAFIVDNGKVFLGYVRDDLQGPESITIYLDYEEAIMDAVQIGGFVWPGTVRILDEAVRAMGRPAVVQLPGGAIHRIIGPESYEEVDHATLHDRE